MNTDVRKAVFGVLLTSEDYMDAFQKIMALKLKDKQERDVVHVIIYCSLQVQSHLPPPSSHQDLLD